MAVPNIFGTATSAIPLSQLDTNFATPVTIGNTAVQLGNTVTSFGNVTLTNVTISSGNVIVTGANVSGTANVSTLVVTGNQTSLGNVAITGNISANIATFGAGSNTAPSITTTGDTNTGIFFPAADTIAFSEGGVEAMRIDSSGNVGIGTSSPQRTLHVQNSSGNLVRLNNSSSANGSFSSIELTSTGGNNCQIRGVQDSSTAGHLEFYTISASAVSERMRIDSSGALLVGATSAPAGLSGSFFIGGGRPLAYSSGSGSLQIKADTGGWQMGTYFIGSSNTNRGGFGVSGADDTLSYYWVGQGGSGAGVQLANGGTSWASLSDEREKNIHGVIENALHKVKQLDGIYYNYKNDEEGARQRVGFSAQKVQAVLPEAVTELQRDLENPTEETKRLSLSTTDLMPLLVQAIKEQQALITKLQADVAALKGASA
jgi:hypothetical protein